MPENTGNDPHEQIRIAWSHFDSETKRAQCLLLGKAIWDTDGYIKNRLVRKLGANFQPSENDLLALGGSFLDFESMGSGVTASSILSTIDSIQAALDRMDQRPASKLATKFNKRLPKAITQLGLVPSEAWQKFFTSITNGDMAGSWMWRSILKDAFERLLTGEAPALFQTTKKNVHGSPLELEQIKRFVVLHIYFMSPERRNVAASRAKITESLVVDLKSVEAWGTELQKTERGKVDIECARLAGREKERFRYRSAKELPDFGSFGFFEGRGKLEIAEEIYWQLLRAPIEFLAAAFIRAKQKNIP